MSNYCKHENYTVTLRGGYCARCDQVIKGADLEAAFKDLINEIDNEIKLTQRLEFFASKLVVFLSGVRRLFSKPDK